MVNTPFWFVWLIALRLVDESSLCLGMPDHRTFRLTPCDIQSVCKLVRPCPSITQSCQVRIQAGSDSNRLNVVKRTMGHLFVNVQMTAHARCFPYACCKAAHMLHILHHNMYSVCRSSVPQPGPGHIGGDSKHPDVLNGHRQHLRCLLRRHKWHCIWLCIA